MFFSQKSGGNDVNLIWIQKRSRVLYMLAAFVCVGSLLFFVGKTPKNQPIEQKAETVQGEEKANTVAQSESVPKNKIHTVKEGETLGVIAEQYNIDVDTLLGANENLGTDIHPGDQLIILPQKGVLYRADMGDTLWRIANTFQVDVAAIMAANDKKDEDLAIGENLFIPGGKKIKEQERLLARAESPVSRGGVSNRFIWPTVGDVSSGYGYRWGRHHDGIDLANDIGTPIRAARSGRVTYSGWSSGYGRLIMIEHDQGYTTFYGHLNESLVESGDYVKAGQSIAYMGNSGNSTGPHLHFEVRKNGTPINPYNVLP